MPEKTNSVRLYRAGSPNEGRSFWTLHEAYARQVHPEGALHEAVLLPGFSQKTFTFAQTDPLVATELEKREADVLVFRSVDGNEEEYYVLNPACIRVEK